jgi:hypothetical protein
MFATTPAMVVYSRVGWRLITVVPLFIFLLLSLKAYQKRRKLKFAILGGFFAGSLFYTYQEGRASIIILGIAFIVWFLRHRTRKQLIHGLVALSSFIATSSLMLIYAYNHFDSWMGRGESLNLFKNGFGQIWSNFVIAMGFFNTSANGNDFFVTEPVLGGPVIVLWVIGLCIALIKIRKFWIEVMFFFIALLPAVLSVPSFHRAAGSIVGIFIFVSIVIAFIERFLVGANKPWNRITIDLSFTDEKQKNSTKTHALTIPVMGVLLVTMIAVQVCITFYTLTVDKTPYKWGFYPETYVVGQYIGHHDAKNIVVLANNFPEAALIFESRSDPLDHEMDFHNYQSYNYPNNTALLSLTTDIVSNKWLDKLYVIERSYCQAFEQSMDSIGYVAKKVDDIKLENSTVASSYRLLPKQ